jgi:hypothetical protein
MVSSTRIIVLNSVIVSKTLMIPAAYGAHAMIHRRCDVWPKPKEGAQRKVNTSKKEDLNPKHYIAFGKNKRFQRTSL